MKSDKKKMKCPNCGTLHFDDEFIATFRYASLIRCPDCMKKVKPNNAAKISNVPNMF